MGRAIRGLLRHGAVVAMIIMVFLDARLIRAEDADDGKTPLELKGNSGGAEQANPPAAPVDMNQILERLNKLEKRNEALEKRNEELEKKIQQQPASPAADQPPSEKDTEASEAGPDAIKRLVQDYLDADAAKKKCAETEQQANGIEVGQDRKLIGNWTDTGPIWRTTDGAFRFHIGSTVQYDTVGYSAAANVVQSIGNFNNLLDPNQGLEPGTAFRRARVRIDGQAYEMFDFIFEYDFASALNLSRRSLGISPPASATTPITNDLDPAATTKFTQDWVGVNQLPIIGTFRAGHQREMVMFTNGTQDAYQIYMERPLSWNAFVSQFEFESGYTLQRNYFNQRAYSLVGIYKDDTLNGGFATGAGDWSYTGRVTCLPVWRDDGNIWVNIGAGTSIRTLQYKQVSFNAQPLERAGTSFEVPNIVNTGTLYSNNGEQLFNLEYASAFGPATLSAEYTYVQVPDAYTGGLPLPSGKLPKGVTSDGDYQADGWYIEGCYFLTRGDHRNIRRDQPGFANIIPKTNFFLAPGSDGPAFGWGAVETGLRVDYLNLCHGPVNGGTYKALTWVLNWYWNPVMRVTTCISYNERGFEPNSSAITTGRQFGDFWSLGTRFQTNF